jgi:hypothetical protein
LLGKLVAIAMDACDAGMCSREIRWLMRSAGFTYGSMNYQLVAEERVR